MDAVIHSALTRPGSVVFPANLPFIQNLEAAGGRVVRQLSGHLVFYGPGNRRFLATDPDGNPLHECEWGSTASGKTRLLRARLHLEWDSWVGLKPEGLVNATTLDLSKKPGWERLKPDDLRQMAAQALRVPLEEVKFFYGDDDLTIDAKGLATIRHKKDAFYVLDDGTFERTRFMACMGAMHWAAIDFLPVVELFQSLLPGTGSATFELIRGLYDDQNPGAPTPLRYRGIPTYPSEAAYRLFSAFFTPQAPGGGDPYPIFMEAPRSHEVTWLPAPDPPLRYFDTTHKLCVTVRGRQVQKVVRQDDPTGLPFVASAMKAPAPFERSAQVAKGTLVLEDYDTRVEIPLNPTWGVTTGSSPLTLSHRGRETSRGGWRGLFGGAPPVVTPREAFSAVLLYPDDDTEISELASQPFVADYLEDRLEQDSQFAARLANADRVLIDNFDAVIASCIRQDRSRSYTVLYRHPAYAQKQAQLIWQAFATTRHPEWATGIVLLPSDEGRAAAYGRPADLLFIWIPFAIYTDTTGLDHAACAISQALAPNGLAFVAGPEQLNQCLRASRLRILDAEPVTDLPTFRMHATILPLARLRAGLTLFTAALG